MSAIDLRLGRWQDVLTDVEPDSLIVDAPYGERTHAKQFHGRRLQNSTRGCANDMQWITSRGLEYEHWSADHVDAFVDYWAPKTRGWFCAFTSHDLVNAYIAALELNGRYVFAPLAVVMPGMNVRLAGDGPSSWCVWFVVARPRELHKWGTLPGAYVVSPGRGSDRADNIVAGQKPLDLMRAVVRDYSRPGDLVCDPCSGGATTLLAAAMEGRRAVGAEMDVATHAKAMARLAKGYTMPLPGTERPAATQATLFDDAETTR
jgi:hypothetical protein